MKKLKIFNCESCNKQQERLVKDDDIVKCSECGEECKKMLSLPRYLGNSTGKSPARR